MNVPHNEPAAAPTTAPPPTVPVTAQTLPAAGVPGNTSAPPSPATQTLIAIAMAVTLSALLWWVLPLIGQLWQALLESSLNAIVIHGATVTADTGLPGWTHLNGLGIAAPLQPPGMNTLGLHVLGALCLGIVSIWLRTPFSSVLRLLAVAHIAFALACVALPNGAPYSIEAHTRALGLESEILLLALPAIMAFTHYIVEYNLERRVFGTLLIGLYLILTLPLKLIAHALLIHAATGLAEPTLFLVFGPALDIFMVTAIYAWVVTWRHNRN